MESDKYIYCPNKVQGKICSKKLAKVGHGKFNRDFTVGCPRCHKLIKYHALSGFVEVVGNIPERDQGSGKRLY